MAIPNWLHLSQNSGNSGTTIVTVTADTYNELTARTASLIAKRNSDSTGKTVSILQNPVPILSISPSLIDNVPYNGSSYTINVTSNCLWTATTNSDWVIISPTTGNGDGVVYVTVIANSSTSRFGMITISTDYDSINCFVNQNSSSGDYSNKYLTFNILSDGIVSFRTVSPNETQLHRTLHYSKDNGVTWSEITSTAKYDSSNYSFNVSAGETVIFKSGYDSYASSTGLYNYFGRSTCRFTVEGNIMSLIYGDNFSGQTVLPNSAYTFVYLFRNCSGLTSTEHLVLPATTLRDFCYYHMFEGCGAMTIGTSVLPATTLAESCYKGMFQGCSSMTTSVSVLPATTLTSECYYEMFYGCSSLTTAPSLPATIAGYYCYNSMFNGCSSLTTAPTLPATIIGYGAYWGMFGNCSGLTTAPELPATTLAPYCYQYMFAGCTSLTTAPELQATTLAERCYQTMFSNCTSLTTAPELPATTLANNCYQEMFYSCSSLTTAPQLPATTLRDFCYNSMFSNCSSLNYIKCLATDISALRCTENWVNGVSSTGTFVKNPNMSSWGTGNSGIPSGWTVRNANDYSSDYLTFNITSGGSIVWKASDSSYTKTISYSTDNGSSWTTITSTTEGTSFNVSTGDKVIFKGTNSTYSTGSGTARKYNTFNGTAIFTAEGNIMSLLYGDNFSGQTTLESANTFVYLFRSCSGLTSAGNLVLPATTLAQSCYYQMFYGCSSLTTAPELPATTLATNCYEWMFDDCSSLTTAPSILPATTLTSACYKGMFQGCSSLTTAPSILPATTLATNCYEQMFLDCTSLTTAPELPATTLANYCYRNMFSNCSSLNYIKCIATDISASYCTNNWVNGVSSTGTFVKNASMNDWSSGTSGIPSGWTVQDAT